MAGLKPDAEISIALATGVMAYASYQVALPAVADVRTLEPGNRDIQAAERVAAWTAAGIVGLVALLTKSPSVFIVGGGEGGLPDPGPGHRPRGCRGRRSGHRSAAPVHAHVRRGRLTKGRGCG